MWIFSETGFVSAVRSPEDRDLIQARSRDKESLASFAALSGCPITPTPWGDYPYRVFVSPAQFSAWVSEVADCVDYSNFKSHVSHTRGFDYAHALSQVWSVMVQTEDEDSRTPDPS